MKQVIYKFHAFTLPFLCSVFKQLAALLVIFLAHCHSVYDRYKTVYVRPLLYLYWSEFPGFHVLLKRHIKEMSFKQVVIGNLEIAVLYDTLKFPYYRR